MISALILAYFIGFGIGESKLNPKNDPKPKPKPEVDLYKVLQSAQKTLEDSWNELNPPHPLDCNCAYCEIALGPEKYKQIQEKLNADPHQMEMYHPGYVRAVMQKNKTLQGEVKNLQLELQRRDIAAANQYPIRYATEDNA